MLQDLRFPVSSLNDDIPFKLRNRGGVSHFVSVILSSDHQPLSLSFTEKKW